MVNAKLVIVGGDAKQTEVQLKILPTTIGRGRDATITLPHSLVSRQHCEIFEEQGQLYVKDLNSLNGTYLNNQKIVGTQTLLPDQLLTLGNVTFRAVYEIGNIDNRWEDNTYPGENSRTEDLFHGDTVDVDFEMLRLNGLQTSTSKNDIPSESDTDHGLARSPDQKSQFRAAPPKTQDIVPPIHIVDDALPAENLSICQAAMETLPHEQAPASFSGKINVPGESVKPVSAVQIDLGSEAASKQDASPSALNVFLKKMPK